MNHHTSRISRFLFPIALVLIGWAGALARADVVFEFLSQPTNQTLLLCREVTFAVAVRAIDNGQEIAVASYQWQRRVAHQLPFEWQDIPGATLATLTLASPQDTASIRCQVAAGGATAFSGTGELTFVSDYQRPAVVSAIATNLETIVVRFNLPIDSEWALDTFNYSLTGVTGWRRVASATMPDPQTVVLTTEPLDPNIDYLLGVSVVTAGPCGGGIPIADGTVIPLRSPDGPVIEIQEQPRGVVVGIYSLASFTVSAKSTFQGSPAPLTYQWQLRGPETSFAYPVDIPEATNATFQLLATNCTAAPWYFRCVLRSGTTTAFTVEASYFAYEDCEPPMVETITASVLANTVTVRFSDFIDISLTDSFNYQITNRQGTSLAILEARRVDERTALLLISPERPLRGDTDYRLVVNYIANLSDEACGCKFITPNTTVPFHTAALPCLTITRQPQSRIAVINCRTTFDIGIRRPSWPTFEPVEFQWLRNGEPIPGATNRTYVTPSLAAVDDQSEFRVRVQSPGCPAIESSNAVLTVAFGVTVPTLWGAVPGLAPNTVIVEFSTSCAAPTTRLDPITAGDPGNYHVSDGIEVQSVTVDCQRARVQLNTTPLAPGQPYVVTVTNVQDIAGNVVLPGNQAAFVAPDFSPPPPGVLEATTREHETLLEWAPGGTLETATQPDGPWLAVQDVVSPYLIVSGLDPCGGQLPASPRYYRVRWP